MSKKPKSVEGVFERTPGTGVWHVRYKVRGKPVRKAIGTRKEAIDYLNKVRYLRSTGDGVLPTTAKRPARTHAELAESGGTLLICDLCDKYLAHIKNPNNPERPKDQVNPPTRIAAIRSAFGERPAGSIKPLEIKHWLIDSVGGAPGTMNRYKSTFSALYRYAKERGLVTANPVRDTQQFKVKLPHPRWLKPQEEERLYAVLRRWIEECPDDHEIEKLELRCHPLEVDVAIGTGLRKSNQYALEEDWCDFAHDLIQIPESKTGDAISVPMIARTKTALRQLLEIRAAIQSLRGQKTSSIERKRMIADGRVFLIRENRGWWERALKEAGIKNFRWHDLRHTTGSRMAQAGVNLKAIQETLTHKSIATTARYAHLNKAALMDAMSVLN